MCKNKKKTVFRIKGLIHQTDLTNVMMLIPSADHLHYDTTFPDQKAEKKGKRPSNRYGHIEIRDRDKEHLSRIYRNIAPYLVRDYTIDFA